MSNPSTTSEDFVEFSDEASRKTHEDLLSKDNEGDYAAFFRELTHQPLESRVNTIARGFAFSIDKVLAVEVYSGSDRERVKGLLLNMANRMAKNNPEAYLDASPQIERAMATIATEKKSSSYHRIDNLIVPAGTELFDSYTVNIESIGPHLVKLFFWLAPSSDLQSRIRDLARNQTKTNVRIYRKWVNRFRRNRIPAFDTKKGNQIKRDSIKSLDNMIQSQVESIVKRDAKGILTANYNGIPIMVFHQCHRENELDSTIGSYPADDRSQFFQLVATAGVNSCDTYTDPTSSDTFLEQDRRAGKELKIMSKFISFSGNGHELAMEILWINTLKEILRFQGRLLDDLQNQIIMRLIAKNRKSLDAQRLQLYQHVSLYETLMFAHDQELESTMERSKAMINKFVWVPLADKELGYYYYGIESIKWLRIQIDEQIPRLREYYQLAKDEFSNQALLFLQRWATIFSCLAVLVSLGPSVSNIARLVILRSIDGFEFLHPQVPAKPVIIR